MKKLFPTTATLLTLSLISTTLLSGCWDKVSAPSIPDEDELPASTITSATSTNTDNNTQYSIYLIALNDQGLNGTEVGCGDSAVPVVEDSKTPNATETQLLTEAFTTLLNTPKDTDSGFNNFLAPSKLKLESASIKDGIATVKLTGQLSLAGECDDPRIKAQLESTAKQFEDIKSAQIFINNKSLAQLMSLK